MSSYSIADDTSTRGIDALADDLFISRESPRPSDEEKDMEQDTQDGSFTSSLPPQIGRGASDGACIAVGKEATGRRKEVGRNRSSSEVPARSLQLHPYHDTQQIVSFDVGGKLFRCKASLIRQYPEKRLNRVISCDTRVKTDTFRIDRNPEHFAMVLDWYRTGKYVLHRNVEEQAFKEDAKYFDLYDELFVNVPQSTIVDEDAQEVESEGSDRDSFDISSPRHSADSELPRTSSAFMGLLGRSSMSSLHSGSPTRSQSLVSNSQTLTGPDATFSLSSLSSDDEEDTNKSPIRYCKQQKHILTCQSMPLVLMMRFHEQLVVSSCTGNGRLLVRVCDATGMQSVLVDQAVVYDSQACFYLQGGRASLEHFLLPGGYTYTFWVERITPVNEEAPRQDKLEVELKLLSNFQKDEQVGSEVYTGENTRTVAPAKTQDKENAQSEILKALEIATSPNVVRPESPASPPFSPSLMLPPHYRSKRGKTDALEVSNE